LGAVILGASFDNQEANARFKENENFPFRLLCDVDKKVGEAYHAGRLGGMSPVPRRITYIIDPDGSIAQSYKVKDALAHPGEVVDDLEQLMRESESSAN